MWTPWEPMNVEIEGDHLAPVIWRDRLYLFWVTFLEKGPQKSPIATVDPTKEIPIPDVRKNIEVHLHWSEYLEGEWSASESSSHSAPSPIILTDQTEFDRNSIFIHVSKEMSGDEERGVQIHLGGKINASFHIAGRNSPPERKDRRTEPENKFVTTGTQANRYSGDDELDVSFKDRIITGPGAASATASPHTIIKRAGAFTVLPCDNHLNPLGVPPYASEAAADPTAVETALKDSIGEIAALMRPVFYQDNSHTFFVEPTVAEQTIEDWQDWVVPTLVPDPGWAGPNWWGKDFVAVADHPWRVPIPELGDPWRDNLDQNSIRELTRSRDWLVNPVTALKFDGEMIGPRGLPGLEVAAPGSLAGGLSVNVSAGSALGSGETVAVRDSHALANSGLARDAASLNIVGGGGFNAALLQNFKQANLAARSGAGMAGIH